MKCLKCGNTIQKRDNYCEKCGTNHKIAKEAIIYRVVSFISGLLLLVINVFLLGTFYLGNHR